jgi:HSP20 family protein
LEKLAMSLSRYEPWNVLTQLHRQLDRAFDAQASAAADGSENSATADWAPSTDIAEFADRWVLQLDVPGVDVNAINITLERGVLSVSGERAKDAEQGREAQGRRIERPQGRFHRRFTLPETIDTESVSATGRNGVLQITIPKQPKSQPRRIEVKAAN